MHFFIFLLKKFENVDISRNNNIKMYKKQKFNLFIHHSLSRRQIETTLKLMNGFEKKIMETPYKENGVFRLGSPSNTTSNKSNPETPDLLKFLQPSLLILSNQKEDKTMSPVFGTSVFNIKTKDLGDVSSTPVETTTRNSSSNTRRRLLTDCEKLTATSDAENNTNDVYLHRLQSNPMFGELSKILAEECLHMQTPTNLINVTWDNSTNHSRRTRNVHLAHLKLQKKFLQFRAEEKFQVAALEIESRYSKDVSKMEIDRYVELGLVMSTQHANAVHERFDYCRLQLVNQVNENLDELLLKLNTQEQNKVDHCRRRLNDSASPLSDYQHDSGLSSDDNSIEYPVKNDQSNIDVLELAMAAADVIPSSDITQHNFNKTFSDISSLLEIFPVARQDVVHCQQPAQQQRGHTDQGPSRLVLKKKIENTDDLWKNVKQQQPKRGRFEDVSSKPRQITPGATRMLNDWYDCHVQYPYPTEDDIQLLMDMTNLSSPQVKKWMANKRVRCFNTLSITGNKHPIKVKLAGKKKSVANSNTYKQLSDQSKKILSDWYEQHIYHPYPTETEKDQLASLAGITKAQVKSWFANRRSRASNRRRQVPNYFLEKFPEYTSHVQMVQVHRDQTRRRNRSLPELNDFQNCYY